MLYRLVAQEHQARCAVDETTQVCVRALCDVRITTKLPGDACLSTQPGHYQCVTI